MADFTAKKFAMIWLLAAIIAVGMIWESNNVDAIEDQIG